MKIEQFERDNLARLRADAEAALEAVAARYGVALKPGRARYTDNQFMLSVEFVVTDSGTALTREWEDYMRFCGMHGLKLEWLGQEFTAATSDHTRYKVVGLHRKNPKNVVAIERVSDGRRFKCSRRVVAAALGAPTTAHALPTRPGLPLVK